MNSAYMTNPLEFLISTLIHLYVFVLMLRFLMQWVRADFYNPISQFVVRITSPLVMPLRRIIPGYKGMDMATLFLAYLFLVLMRVLIFTIKGYDLAVPVIMVYGLTDLISLTIDIFFFAILIQVILSWVNPHGHNPAISLLYSITAPVMKPVQRLIPPIGGMDVSPIFAIIGLKLIEMLINPLLLSLVH